MITVIAGKILGEHLFITLQSDSCEEVNSATARKVAYEARHKYGFSNAGIDVNGSSYVVDMDKDDPQNEGLKGKEVEIRDMAEMSKRASDIGYRQVYRLTRSLM